MYSFSLFYYSSVWDSILQGWNEKLSMNLTNLSFHESSIISFYRKGQDIVLFIEDITVSEEKVKALLMAYSIESVDDGKNEITDNDFMLFDDGEILNILINDNLIEVVIEWVDYKNNLYKTLFYSIKCKKNSLAVLLGEDNISEVLI